VIDSGVNLAHTEFEGRARYGWVAPGLYPADKTGHGTHIAGLTAGKTHGVAKNANIISVKVIDQLGDWDDIIAGVNWVTGKVKSSGRPAIACLALETNRRSEGINEAVNTLIDSGITAVASAGNDAKDASDTSPGSVLDAIVVGASDIKNNVAWSSNFGPSVTGFAPGVDITSAWITGPNSTMRASGGSQATAQVAGIAANWLSMYPYLSPAQIKSHFRSIATTGILSGVPPGTSNVLAFNDYSTGPPLTSP